MASDFGDSSLDTVTLTILQDVKVLAVGNRWGLEAMIGGGYVSMKYTKYKCAECAEASGSYSRSYFGPTRIGFSVIYFLR